MKTLLHIEHLVQLRDNINSLSPTFQKQRNTNFWNQHFSKCQNFLLFREIYYQLLIDVKNVYTLNRDELLSQFIWKNKLFLFKDEVEFCMLKIF